MGRFAAVDNRQSIAILTTITGTFNPENEGRRLKDHHIILIVEFTVCPSFLI
jgi:hypothetical protein